LDVDSLDSEQLKNKAGELWDTIIRLETEKYDLEARQDRQNYDLKELKERQKITIEAEGYEERARS